jgi:hypothetical protein
MADKKISALTSLAQGDVAASTDVLPIVDTSATETKKITASALVGAGMTAGVTNVDINSGSIDGTTIGASSASTGAFTTLSASSTVSGTGFSTYLASPPAIGGTTAAAGSFTTLTTSSTVTLNGGTANGVLYLNGSKVATSGSALTFDGANLATTGNLDFGTVGAKINFPTTSSVTKNYVGGAADGFSLEMVTQRGAIQPISYKQDYSVGHVWSLTGSSAMALTSTGLGIGTSSPGAKLDVRGNATFTGNATARQTADFTNTGGQIYVGVESSAGGAVFTGSSAYAGILGTNNTTALQLATNGAVRATLDSSGNLGLGVTPSAWGSTFRALQMTGAASIAGTTDPSLQVSQNAYYNGTNWIYSTTAAASNYNQAGGVHAWRIAASGTVGNTISFTQAMTLSVTGANSNNTTLNLKGGAGGGSDVAKIDFERDGTGVLGTIQLQRDGGNGAGALQFFTNNGSSNSERARIPATGGFQVKTCVSVGDATPAASGAGVTFPATQSASSDANTLDDYEEGSWTPVLRFGGSSAGITYNTSEGGAQGQYVKIGKQVTAWFAINLSNKGAGSGNADVTGLPFNTANTFYNENGGFINYSSDFNSLKGTPTVYVGNGPNMSFYQPNANSGSITATITPLAYADFNNGARIWGCVVYQAA